MQTATIPASDTTPESRSAASGASRYEASIPSRFLPVGWLDGIAAAAANLIWFVLLLITLFVSLLGLQELLGIARDAGALSSYANDAFEKLWGLVYLAVLVYLVYRWMRCARIVAIGPGGMQFRRRFGRPLEFSWEDIRGVAKPGQWVQFSIAAWPAIPSRLLSFTLSAFQVYRISGKTRTIYFAPDDHVAFESAISRWQVAPASTSPVSWMRKIRGWAARLLSPVLVGICFAPAFTLTAAFTKYITDDAATGAGYQSTPLLRAFALKPSAAEPEALRKLLLAGVRVGDEYVVRKTLERLGSIREMEFERPVVELAVLGYHASASGRAAQDTKSPEVIEGPDGEKERAGIIRMLIARGARIEQGTLLAAARYERGLIFSTLVELGAPLDDVNDDGVPDIAQAATESAAALRSFLQAKSNPNQVDDDGRTALFLAAAAGSTSSIELLLKHGATLDATDRDGNTPLLYLLQVSTNPKSRPAVSKTARLLIERGARLDAVNRAGVTLAHAAAGGADLPLFEGIVDKGGGYRARDGSGRMLLHRAAMGQNVEVARHLIEAGADVNATSEGGETPLHSANGKEVTVLLLDRGARIEARNRALWTPLHEAVITSDTGKATVLLQRGARKDVTDADGKTPYDYISRTTGKPSPSARKLTDLLRP